DVAGGVDHGVFRQELFEGQGVLEHLAGGESLLVFRNAARHSGNDLVAHRVAPDTQFLAGHQRLVGSAGGAVAVDVVPVDLDGHHHAGGQGLLVTDVEDDRPED